LKLDESLFNTAYGVVKVKNGLYLGENYRNINGCKTFAASIAHTLVDKQVQFQILSNKRKR
jgi:Tfp pilus assembly protein PilP